MKVLGVIDTEVDVVSKKYVDDKINEVVIEEKLRIPYIPKVLSESEYNQLEEKDPQTIYFIKEN